MTEGKRRRRGWAQPLAVCVCLVIIASQSGAINKVRQHRQRAAITTLWPQLTARDAPMIGKSAALDTILEFSDYECPACKAARSVVDSFARNSVVVLRQLPLPQHRRAKPLIAVAECAAKQKRIDSIHARLYQFSAIAAPDALFDSISAVADDLGLNPVEFNLCRADGTVRSRISMDSVLVAKLNIVGTPTFVGKKGLFTGVPTVAILHALSR